MKIPFMLRFPTGEETHFIEKLWKMAIQQEYCDRMEFFYYRGQNMNIVPMIPYDNFTPKLHTIRKKSDRFKVGQKVQPFVWSYKPYKRNPNPLIPAQFDFMPPLEIVSKQRFDLKFVQTVFGTKAMIYIDGKLLEDESEYENLAVNDGFENADHFFQYFNTPVEGMEIRHFTNLIY